MNCARWYLGSSPSKKAGASIKERWETFDYPATGAWEELADRGAKLFPSASPQGRHPQGMAGSGDSALLLGCGLRRAKVANLRLDHSTMGRTLGSCGFGGRSLRIRTVSMPDWVKARPTMPLLE